MSTARPPDALGVAAIDAHAKLPPGPRLPAAVQLVRMSTEPYRFLAECRARYGDLVTLRLPGGRPQIFACDPETVRALVTGGYDDFLRDGEAIRFLLGDHMSVEDQKVNFNLFEAIKNLSDSKTYFKMEAIEQENEAKPVMNSADPSIVFLGPRQVRARVTTADKPSLSSSKLE